MTWAVEWRSTWRPASVSLGDDGDAVVVAERPLEVDLRAVDGRRRRRPWPAACRSTRPRHRRWCRRGTPRGTVGEGDRDLVAHSPSESTPRAASFRAPTADSGRSVGPSGRSQDLNSSGVGETTAGAAARTSWATVARSVPSAVRIVPSDRPRPRPVATGTSSDSSHWLTSTGRWNTRCGRATPTSAGRRRRGRRAARGPPWSDRGR